jgi:hypothetical protein
MPPPAPKKISATRRRRNSPLFVLRTQIPLAAVDPRCERKIVKLNARWRDTTLSPEKRLAARQELLRIVALVVRVRAALLIEKRKRDAPVARRLNF